MLSSRSARRRTDKASSNSVSERTSTSIGLLFAAGCAGRALQGGADAARQIDMVVLDQHAVAKIEAMVEAAAAGHGVFVEHAQSGHGFARVENAGLGAGNLVHVLAGGGGDAAHALQHVQDHPLAGEQRARLCRMTATCWPLLTRTPSKIS